MQIFAVKLTHDMHSVIEKKNRSISLKMLLKQLKGISIYTAKIFHNATAEKVSLTNEQTSKMHYLGK